MILTDLIYKSLAFIILFPILSGLFRFVLLIQGKGVLADVDIALFFTGPIGWVSAILLGAVWLGVFALEQASLLGILAANSLHKHLTTYDALIFAGRNTIPTLRVAGRIVALSLIVTAPFLLIGLGAYSILLGQYDINYYLADWPREFWIAIGFGGLIAGVHILVLLRLFSGWLLALPLVLFEHTSPRNALSLSRKVIAGNRFHVFLWIMGWLLLGFVMNAISSIVISGIGYLLVPSSIGSLTILSGRVGLMLCLLALSSLAINVLSTVSFALILFHAYSEIAPQANQAIADLQTARIRETPTQRRLNRKRLVAWSLVGTLIAALLGINTINSLQLEDHVQVMAHRGASHAAPENSLAAMREAIKLEADWVEIDVQETADGEVVVIHDSDLMKLAKSKLKIWEATREEIQKIDIGRSFGSTFVDEHVPTLSEVLELCRGKIGVIIELKYYGHDKQLEQRVVDIVEKLDMAKEVMVMSLKAEGVRKLKALRPAWKCGVLLSVSLGSLDRIEGEFLAINARFATRSLVNQAHRMGKEVYVWTVDDAASISMMINRGVDGVLTNQPGVARKVLAERATMSSSERLLAEVASLFGGQTKIREQ